MKKLIKKLFSRNTKKEPVPPRSLENHEPKILTRDAHVVSRNLISKNALKVLYRLNDAGFQSYLVGGGVRDILLGLRPKDFDIATDATPEEIRGLFRNCRLIGRRFRLAHILYGREVIEVATFRASHDNSAQQSEQSFVHRGKKNAISQTSEQGMLTRDNVFGSLEDDAFRRDFTINALYYTVKNFSIIDYTDGLEDLAKRQLRLIGDPVARYREDPVRMLRAIRLASKLNLKIEACSAEPIAKLADLLAHVSSARLWDECNKLLLAGHARKTWEQLRNYEVAPYLFYQTCAALDSGINKSDQSGKISPSQQKQATINSKQFEQFIFAALDNTDKRIKNAQPVTPAFLFAVFLWKPVEDLTQSLINKGLSPYEASQKAASKVMEKQREAIGIPKRFSIVAKEIWSLQFRFKNRRRKGVHSLIGHPRFRAAYDFLCLRSNNEPTLKELARWWTVYQDANSETQNQMINDANRGIKGKPRSNKSKRHYKNKRKPSRSSQ